MWAMGLPSASTTDQPSETATSAGPGQPSTGPRSRGSSVVGIATSGSCRELAQTTVSGEIPGAPNPKFTPPVIPLFLVLFLFLSLFVWGLWIARSSKDGFGAMLAVGTVGTLFWPAAINIAMVLGLAPVIGVPLPLFSYGGSAILSSAIALGLLFNVSMRRYVF